MEYSSLFRKIKDFPKEGIIFEDVTTYWKDADAFAYSIRELSNHFRNRGITKVVGLEARGFVIAAPIALELKSGFIPIRKPNKLPSDKISCAYSLEYGENVLEIHKDAIIPGDKVLICDDILATGGTIHASEELIEELGGKIEGIATLSELVFLNGRAQIKTEDIFSLYKVMQ